MGREEIHTEFWSGILNERTVVENINIGDKIRHFCKKQWKACCTVDFVYRRAMKHNVLEYKRVSFFRYWKELP
jgi:hypothetical protein